MGQFWDKECHRILRIGSSSTEALVLQSEIFVKCGPSGRASRCVFVPVIDVFGYRAPTNH